MVNFNEEIRVSYYLDQSREDKSGKFRVRLQVYNKGTKKRKYYNTVFAFTSDEYKRVWLNKRTKGVNEKHKREMIALIARANEAVDQLSNFSFEDFERLLFNKHKVRKDINFYYQKTIARYKKKESISTSKNYESALKCLIRFNGKSEFNFFEVSVSWLEEFQKFCTEKENKSLTTVSIYLRTLRTIFNDAIADKAISPELYPFGRRKYQIPNPKGVKKALSSEQLKTLFEGVPKTIEQEKAKDFWFFSYLCNGMNFKDILNLKFKDIEDEYFTFFRAKTKTTNKGQKRITVYLNDFTKTVIQKYQNKNKSQEAFVFPLLREDQSPEERHRLIKNFIRSVNQNFLKFAKTNGIEEKISSYWARHSFTTMAIRKGASLEFVGEAVGHSDIKTTMNYFSGFEDETKKAFSDKLLDF